MSINITLSQTGKAPRPVTLNDGATLKQLLNDVLMIDAEGKSVMVGGRKFHSPYETELLDGDTVSITTNSVGA